MRVQLYILVFTCILSSNAFGECWDYWGSKNTQSALVSYEIAKKLSKMLTKKNDCQIFAFSWESRLSNGASRKSFLLYDRTSADSNGAEGYLVSAQFTKGNNKKEYIRQWAMWSPVTNENIYQLDLSNDPVFTGIMYSSEKFLMSTKAKEFIENNAPFDIFRSGIK